MKETPNDMPDGILIHYRGPVTERFENTFDLWVLPDSVALLSDEMYEEPTLRWEPEDSRWALGRAVDLPEDQTLCFYEASRFNPDQLDLAVGALLDMAGKPAMDDWAFVPAEQAKSLTGVPRCYAFERAVWLSPSTGWWHYDRDSSGMFECAALGQTYVSSDVVKVRHWLRSRFHTHDN